MPPKTSPAATKLQPAEAYPDLQRAPVIYPVTSTPKLTPQRSWAANGFPVRGPFFAATAPFHGYGRPMRLPALLPALVLAASPLMALTPEPNPSPATTLTEAHRIGLRCAAAFAIVAMSQANRDATPGWPPLALRGKTFFADTGERVMREAGLSREAVRALLTTDVQALQRAPDPDAALAALAQPCLAQLDATVPPLEVPDLGQCAAILGLAYDEVHAREGMTATARDLKTLAMVLADRHRKTITSTGGSSTAAEMAVAKTRAAIETDAAAGGGGVDRYDIAHCYDLAKPEAKSHY